MKKNNSIADILREAEHGKLESVYYISGWVKFVQTFNSLTFISINDGSCLSGLQIVINDESFKNTIFSPGDAISAQGILTPSRGKKQKFELKAQNLKILNKVGKDFPLLPVKLSLNYLRNQQLVRHRTSLFQAVFEIRKEVIHAMFCYFYKRNFFPVMAPILSSNSCEGGAELFKLSSEDSNFFKKDAVLLSVSGQFYCEVISLGLRNSFSFGPTFRAEKSNSSLHLAEFWMIEVEIAFTNLSEIIEFTYNFFIHLISQVLKNCQSALKELSRSSEENNSLIEKLSRISEGGYEIITYSEGIEILKNNRDINWGDDLNKEDEQFLCQKLNTSVLFVTEFPSSFKPFYMKRSEDKKITYSFDMLVENLGEIAGGSEREGSLSRLRKNIEEAGLQQKELEWYLKLREYGYYSSAGFGLGFERLLMLLTGLKNIKDLSVFPRYYEHLQL